MSDDLAHSHLLKDLRGMEVSDWISEIFFLIVSFEAKSFWLDCNHFLS